MSKEDKDFELFEKYKKELTTLFNKMCLEAKLNNNMKPLEMMAQLNALVVEGMLYTASQETSYIMQMEPELGDNMDKLRGAVMNRMSTIYGVHGLDALDELLKQRVPEIAQITREAVAQSGGRSGFAMGKSKVSTPSDVLKASNKENIH